MQVMADEMDIHDGGHLADDALLALGLAQQLPEVELREVRERSFLAQVQHDHASGGDLDALVYLSLYGKGRVRIDDARHFETRLYYAVLHGWCSAVNWLVEQGADVHVCRPGSRRTPLRTAVLYDQRAAAVLLLDAGARVDERDERGQTALHEAAVFGRLAICKLLLSRGASLDARNNSGEDPEAVARDNGKTTAADLLAAVRAAGSLRAYVATPRVQLLVLRILCEKDRASSPDTFLARRLFPCETERRAPLRSSRYARAALPKELFWHIVQFWRSDRDI